MSREIIPKCQNLSIGYTSALKKDLSFNLPTKKILLINGKNGSGKSTLIKTLLKKISPIRGSFEWSVSESSISYLPQITNPNSSFSYTVNEILDLYFTSKEIREIPPSTLDKKSGLTAVAEKSKKQCLLLALTLKRRCLFLTSLLIIWMTNQL